MAVTGNSYVMQKLTMLKTIASPSQILLFLVFLFFAQGLYGQVKSESDTIKIKEVVITRKQISSEQPGFKFFSIDSSGLYSYDHFFLNDLLRDATPLFIKEYGTGLTSTASFRGTSAGQTKVTWNGININDPMLGQTDFSLVPSGMIDNVMVSFGGASMDLGTGAIGGIINLGNEPSWKKETLIYAAPGAGSFGRYTGLVKVSTGSSRFQSVTKAWLNTAENDFRFLNTEATSPQWSNREHNQLSQKSFMQELYFRKSKNVLSARFWYQSASRNLPGSILWGYSGEKQSDESFRSLISYDGVAGNVEFFSSSAFLMSNMLYSSYFDTTGARNSVRSVIRRDGMTMKIGDYTDLKVVINEELHFARSDYYQDDEMQYTGSLTLSAERKKGKWFGAAILMRETLDGLKFLAPDFSAGCEIRTIPGEEHYLKLNISRNSKIPSFNDRFWNPGGNSELENEYAYSFEAGYKLDHNTGSSLSFGSEINYFNNYIRNMIQWYPQTEFIWVTGNIGKANTSGIEASASLKYNPGRFSLNLNTGYSYTRAKDIASEETSLNQMIYIPEHKANGTMQVSYRNFYSSWITNVTGRTYTTSDNSTYLDKYLINSLSCGFKLNISEHTADLRLKVENIFNKAYQTIAYYPQPGRTYFLVLSFRFKA